MSNDKWRRAERERRYIYLHGWDILRVWAGCCCEPGACPMETEMAKVGVTPGSLLVALVTGQPERMIEQ